MFDPQAEVVSRRVDMTLCDEQNANDIRLPCPPMALDRESDFRMFGDEAESIDFGTTVARSFSDTFGRNVDGRQEASRDFTPLAAARPAALTLYASLRSLPSA